VGGKASGGGTMSDSIDAIGNMCLDEIGEVHAKLLQEGLHHDTAIQMTLAWSVLSGCYVIANALENAAEQLEDAGE
jgi:hypothetical protein